MGSLSIALLNSAQSQRVLSQALTALQTNISNVNTPGYASQEVTFINQPFNPDTGLPGGVRFGELQSTRSTYAEQAVRDQQGSLNLNQQLATDLAQLNPAFDLQSKSSIPETLAAFFNSFSTLAVSPNDPLARQQVLSAASNVVQSFHNTAAGIGKATTQADNQITDTLHSINSDIGAIQGLNAQRRNSPESAHDAGIDAEVYAKLEDLSQYVNIQALQQPDGTVNVYLGGQTPLLVGTHVYSITANPSPTSTSLTDSTGRDVTGVVTSGKLAGLLNEKNTLLPGYTSQLNQLAQGFADQVNTQLRSGLDSTGSTPGIDLFSYDPAAGAASTFAVTAIQPDQVAAASAGAPGGNGNALTISQMGTAKSLNGLSFSQFYGTLAGSFGRDLSNAQQNVTSGQALLSQAQTNRSQISGVSLDREAAQLVQFQQAYQAAGEMFRVLNQLAQDEINLLR